MVRQQASCVCRTRTIEFAVGVEKVITQTGRVENPLEEKLAALDSKHVIEQGH